MEVMVGHNSYCCGEVQASDVSPDGDGVTGICMSYVGWKATGLRAEEQVIALPCPRVCVRFRSVTTEGEHERERGRWFQNDLNIFLYLWQLIRNG